MYTYNTRLYLGDLKVITLQKNSSKQFFENQLSQVIDCTFCYEKHPSMYI